MDGTSSPTPIAHGTVARRLARDAAVLAMPRDRERARKIRDLALDACEDICLALSFQGHVLAR